MRIVAVLLLSLALLSCKETINVPDAQVVTIRDTVYIQSSSDDITVSIERYLKSTTLIFRAVLTNNSSKTYDSVGVVYSFYIKKSTSLSAYDSLLYSQDNYIGELPPYSFFDAPASSAPEGYSIVVKPYWRKR